MKILLLGYFSTVGDIEVLAVLRLWLDKLRLPYDVAAYSRQANEGIDGAVGLEDINPRSYTHLVIVCGPFYEGFYPAHGIDMKRFSHCVVTGFNLSMIESLANYNPFDYLIARDGVGLQRCDASFLYEAKLAPVFGICLAPDQNEYKGRQKHGIANEFMRQLVVTEKYAAIKLNTQFPLSRNETWISSPEAFESVCSRIDVMLTTRLHGLVLALKQGTPVVAIDPIVGGGKVSAQGAVIGWPFVYCVGEVNYEVIKEAAFKCLTSEYKMKARDCAETAKRSLSSIREDLLHGLLESSINSEKHPLPSVVKTNKKFLSLCWWRRKISRMVFRSKYI